MNENITLNRTVVPIAVVVIVLLFVTVPVVRVWALEWWQANPPKHLSPEQKALDKWELQQYFNELTRIQKNLPPLTFEQQIQLAKEHLALIAAAETSTNNMTRTEDDGYTYPKNATAEEKAAIDTQELQAWEGAGRPGEVQLAPHAKVSPCIIRPEPNYTSATPQELFQKIQKLTELMAPIATNETVNYCPEPWP
jgi:hypothetical protein